MNLFHIGMLRKKTTIIAAAFLILSCIGYLALQLTQWNQPVFTDFKIYHDAGAKAVQRHTVYDVRGHYQFKYAPFIALLFGFTISEVPFDAAKIAYYAFMLCLWICFIVDVSTVCLRSFSGFRPAVLSIAACFALFLALYAVPLREELRLGQINIVAIYLLFGFFVLYGNGSRNLFLLSALLSFAIQFKLYALVALPFLIFRREYFLLLGIFLSFAFWNIVVFSMYGGWRFAVSELYDWLITLFASSEILLVSTYNISLIGIVGKHVSGFYAKEIVWAVGVLGLLFLQYRFCRAHFLISAAICLFGIVLLNPLSWPYWGSFLFPAALTLALHHIAKGHLKKLFSPAHLPIIPLIAFIVFASNDVNSSRAHMGITTAGHILLLCWFLIVLLRNPGRFVTDGA